MNIYYASQYGSDWNDGLTKVSPKTFQGACDMCVSDFDVVVALTPIPSNEMCIIGRHQPDGITFMLGYKGQTEREIVETVIQQRMEMIPMSEDPSFWLMDKLHQVLRLSGIDE